MYQFLRLRRANERTIDISSSKADELLGDDLLTFKGEDKLWDSKLARKPLSASQTETLVKAAIELHARAVAQNNLKTWMMPLESVAVGSFIAISGQLLLKTGNQTTATTPKGSAIEKQTSSAESFSIDKVPPRDNNDVQGEGKSPMRSLESHGSKRTPENTSADSGP
jgi:hypothetical protein